jgi:hypothetical protein
MAGGGNENIERYDQLRDWLTPRFSDIAGNIPPRRDVPGIQANRLPPSPRSAPAPHAAVVVGPIQYPKRDRGV